MLSAVADGNTLKLKNNRASVIINENGISFLMMDLSTIIGQKIALAPATTSKLNKFEPTTLPIEIPLL